MSFWPLQTVLVCVILGLMFSEQATSSPSKTHLDGRALVGKQGLTKPQSNGKFEQLGCTFENSNYKTNQTNQPIWQKKPKSEKLNNITFEELKKDVKELFIKAVTVTGYNSIDPFLWFIQAYIKYSGEKLPNRNKVNKDDLLKFFNEYNVPYYADENPVGILIQTFDKLNQAETNTKERKSLEKEAYFLASAYLAPRNLNRTNLNEGYPELKNKRFQDHVAGVIKFKLSWTYGYGERAGYILLDPGFYHNHQVVSPYAIVLMEDQQPPHQELIWGILDNVTFSMANSSDMWVIAHNLVPEQSVVYYLGQAYCSFLESTTKGLLLKPYKAIINFDEQSDPKAYLTILTRALRNYDQEYFTMGSFVRENKEDDLTSIIFHYNFSQILDHYDEYKNDNPMVLKHLENKIQKDITIDSALLGLTTKTLVDRLYFYYHHFYADKILSKYWMEVASSFDPKIPKPNLIVKMFHRLQAAKKFVSYAVRHPPCF